MKPEDKAELLKTLGMDKMAEKLLRKKTGKDKLLKAIDRYRYATGEDLDDFNKEIKESGRELVVVPIKDYAKLPPDDVLEDLKKAQAIECFDSLELALADAEYQYNRYKHRLETATFYYRVHMEIKKRIEAKKK